MIVNGCHLIVNHQCGLTFDKVSVSFAQRPSFSHSEGCEGQEPASRERSASPKEDRLGFDSLWVVPVRSSIRASRPRGFKPQRRSMSRNATYLKFALLMLLLVALAVFMGSEPWGPI